MRVFIATCALLCATAPARSQSPRPLPAEEPFFAAARENLARAGQEQWRYAYKERRTELHMNPFGRLGSGGTRVFDVVPTAQNVTSRRLLERDGKPVPNAQPERQERRSRPQGRSAVADTVATLQFRLDRREVVNGRDTIVVAFEPKPNAKPQTREGRLARSFKGLIWVDEEAREVTRVEATAIDDLSFGYGVVARLNSGTSVQLARERVDDRLWLPTSLRFMGEGRALLVRKLHVNHVIEWFDYRKVL
jgi:hypothetical protein